MQIEACTVKIINDTPLATLPFSAIDEDGDPVLTVVAKGAFDIVPNEAARFSETPALIRTIPVFWDPDKPSSLRFEDDVAPFKPCADVIVNGTAYAPNGNPLPSLRAGVRIGNHEKRITVTGPRAWVHTPLLGWSLSPIVPVQRVALRYELAFGGEGLDSNPVGIGRINRTSADKSKTILAPQILCEDGVTPKFGEAYAVEGFGAIQRAWQPRRARAGTFGEESRQSEGRKLPNDFDPTYWNAAHPDLCADDFFRGNEDVTLSAMHPDYRTLCFRLPGQIVGVGVVHASGFRDAAPARLDTVFIDADAMKMELTWRATLPLFKEPVRSVHVGMRSVLKIGGAI